MESIVGKVVVVTGAGQRLGFKITQYLIENGAFVVATYHSEGKELLTWIASNDTYRSKVILCNVDLTQSLTPLETILKAVKAPITALINCAATFERGTLQEVDSFQRQLQINTIAPLRLTALFSQVVSKGSVVNILDGNIRRYNSTYQNYRVSKLFLQELTRQLAFTYQGHLRVNAVAPGTVLPPEDALLDTSYQKAKALPLTEETPTVDDLFSALLLLLQNSAITGEVIAVDGGVHCL